MVGLLLLAAAGLWGASGLTWSHVTATTPGTGAVTATEVPVAEAVPSVTALALVALAGVAAAFALGPGPRRVAGVLLVGSGAVAVVGGLSGGADSAWPVLALVAAGIVLAAAGVVLAVVAGRLPAMGARYAAPGAAKEAARGEDDLWQALSEGEDPTAGK
ncbi:Trp biosynthesis-associated membrane protein [Actinokineospora sp. G85]|uniref:Trp biosynthesis-associated membrane protein n=1 Tax=Actinokineospora sp. G85 TaxID=3406626 RepID=UPI003C70C56E